MAGCAQPQHAGGRRALEVLPCDEVQRPLLQPEPDDALLATEGRGVSAALRWFLSAGKRAAANADPPCAA